MAQVTKGTAPKGCSTGVIEAWLGIEEGGGWNDEGATSERGDVDDIKENEQRKEERLGISGVRLLPVTPRLLCRARHSMHGLRPNGRWYPQLQAPTMAGKG
jgi:hypothetical protein